MGASSCVLAIWAENLDASGTGTAAASGKDWVAFGLQVATAADAASVGFGARCGPG